MTDASAIMAAQTAAFVAKARADSKAAKQRGADVPGAIDPVATAAAGNSVLAGSTHPREIADHHFSQIDVTKLVLGADKRYKNKKPAGGAAAGEGSSEMIKVFVKKTENGAMESFRMIIPPFVLGASSDMNWEGTLKRKKAPDKKAEESVRGDCYFLATMWPGILDGRTDEDDLLAEQQDALKKIYSISRTLLRLLFDNPAALKFRNKCIGDARLDLKADYIALSPKFAGQQRPQLAHTDFEEIEKANPDLLEQVLLHARENFFLPGAKQFPGRPSEDDVARGHKYAQMFSMRKKVWPFQEGKFDPTKDSKKKYEPLPGVPSDIANWPTIYEVMTTDGRREYRPPQWANGQTGVMIPHPKITLESMQNDQAGKARLVKKQYEDPSFNPAFEKPLRKRIGGKVVEETMQKVVSLIATAVTFQPYVGPEQWGVKMWQGDVLSIMDSVPRVKPIVTSNLGWARGYDEAYIEDLPDPALQAAAEQAEAAAKAAAALAAASARPQPPPRVDTDDGSDGGNESSGDAAPPPRQRIVLTSVPAAATAGAEDNGATHQRSAGTKRALALPSEEDDDIDARPVIKRPNKTVTRDAIAAIGDDIDSGAPLVPVARAPVVPAQPPASGTATPTKSKTKRAREAEVAAAAAAAESEAAAVAPVVRRARKGRAIAATPDDDSDATAPMSAPHDEGSGDDAMSQEAAAAPPPPPPTVVRGKHRGPRPTLAAALSDD